MDKLDEFLERNGLSLAAFGRQIGVPSKTNMWRYKNGERSTPLPVVKAAHEATGGAIDLEYWLSKRDLFLHGEAA